MTANGGRLMSAIPDDIIEVMAKGMFGQDWTCGVAELDGFRKALAAAEAMGWKLVPKDPTPEMVDDGWEQNSMSDDDRAATDSEELIEWIWAAMISAAPSVKP